jgi:hypothetical protein
MIEVNGTAKILVDYSIEVEMTVEEWDALSQKKQDEYIENHVDWMDACRSGEVDDIDVDDVIIVNEDGEEIKVLA